MLAYVQSNLLLHVKSEDLQEIEYFWTMVEIVPAEAEISSIFLQPILEWDQRP